MKAEIVTIGTEILLGEIVDTNAVHIAKSLRDIGVSLYFKTTVGDNLHRITDILKLGLSRSDVIITTGGLGPTVDDMTRQGVAAAVGRELVFHPNLFDQIAERFARFGVQMSENNRQQAYIPAEAIPIENPVGTAPCFIVESEAGTIISLPGVPSEMKYLLKHNVIPYLREKMGVEKIIKPLVLRTAGIGESVLDSKIADYMTYTNPTVGLSAHMGQTDIRITVLADNETEADQKLAEMEAKIRERVGSYIYGSGIMPLEQAFVEILQKYALQLMVCEVGTQGALSARIQSALNGQDGVLQTQIYETIEDFFGAFPYLSERPLLAQAETLVRTFDQKGVLGIVIITEAHGTVLSVAYNDDVRTRGYGYGGSEINTPVWAGTWSMSMAWRLLREKLEGADE